MVVTVFGHHGQEPYQLILLVVRRVFELGVREQRIEDTKVGVSEWHRGRWEVEQVPEDDIEKDVQVICVEVLVCGRGGKEEVEELED